MAEKNLPNLRVLTPILIDGKHAEAGTVIAKSDIEKTDWQNLVFGFGNNPRLEETDDAVGKPKAAKAAAAMPGAAT